MSGDCPKCGKKRDYTTKLCHSCYMKEWRARQSGRLCPACGEVKPVFTMKDKCSTCYHRERRARMVGSCGRCGKTRRIPSGGLCAYCNREASRPKRTPRVCVQCGRTADHFAKGRCRPCYTNNTKRKKNYGLSPEDYSAMLIDQRGLCAICQEPLKRQPHIDHDHATGQVRNLLCYRCNIGLGSFGDSPERLHAAAAYLEFHRSRKVA